MKKEKDNKPAQRSAESAKTSLVEVDKTSTGKESIKESVVDEKNKGYIFTDHGIRDFPDNFPAPEKVIIEKSHSVGKLFVKDEVKFRGTCWIYFERLEVLTCWHSIKDQAYRFSTGTEKWQIDFNSIKETKKDLYLFDVIKIREANKDKDVALLRINAKLENPAPLEVSTNPINIGQAVYIIGYPAKDPDNNPKSDDVFDQGYDVKTFMPGKITSVSENFFSHNCSTLPGVSGAPIFDATSGKVIGMHSRGEHKKENHGIPIKLVLDTIGNKKG